jgi:predicted nucleotidyltransferase
MMGLIMEIRFGSHLYGTATPQSDLDFKAVYIPDARDILLQRVRDNIGISPDKEPGARNSPGDVDREIFSLQRYLSLLAEGQTMALDMLFAPDLAMTMAPAPLWREVQMNAHRLVTRRASAFLRYCRQQANKYGIKGSRIAVARQVLAVLESVEAAYGTTAKLAVAETEMNAFEAGADHSAFVDLPTPSGQIVRHLEVCGKKMPFTSSIKSARDIAQRLVDEYGQRALQAEQNQGIDWKALSHAVRVGREALELFTTGRITFPLACANEILSIKRGELKYESVAETIEELLVQVEAAADTSGLPESPDQTFIDDLVARAYRAKIAEDR